jgi:hypothetical protein
MFARLSGAVFPSEFNESALLADMLMTILLPTLKLAAMPESVSAIAFAALNVKPSLL